MIRVSVIATSGEGTREALRVAGEMAARGPSRLFLFVRCGDRAALPPPAELLDTTVLTYSGRAGDLPHLVPKSTPVVLGGRAGIWRPTPEQRLARRFAELGYRVIYAPSPPVRTTYSFFTDSLHFLYVPRIDSEAVGRSSARSGEGTLTGLVAAASALVLAVPPVLSLLLAAAVAVLWCLWLDERF